ncbi:hypothetical protein JHK84_043460 [Glycine max]|nr:hypothetical protein JHK86_043278 [Glycine max]KAG4957534.1 hypothetical protein JHK85_043914 [Glycine max]KAG5117347.1 hypothetical protein JHK84_043460 [Glycine max]
MAITCGNTFVLKPSEKDPEQDIVNAICDDDDIKAISFVGSNFVGIKASFAGDLNFYSTMISTKPSSSALAQQRVNVNIHVCKVLCVVHRSGTRRVPVGLQSVDISDVKHYVSLQA